jgi:6-phosphofructokinase 1
MINYPSFLKNSQNKGGVMKNIGVITSGGDCGGLNAVIKGAAMMANKHDMHCYVIPNGYAGLYNLVDFDNLVELTPQRLDSIDANLAGSEAGHSRVKIKKIDNPDKYQRIKKGLEKFNIDGLVISGGDDTGSVIVDLSEQGIKCVHAPKTMDLDLQTYSVGADSAINRIAKFAHDLRTTARTHNRIIVLEAFGRYAGHTALRGGIAGEADAILIPEIPANFDILYQHLKTRFTERIKASDVTAGCYIIVVAEGIKDASGKELIDEAAGVDSFGHKKLAGAGKYVCQEITKKLKADPQIKDFMQQEKMFVPTIYEIPEIRQVRPGHLVRCGNSSAYDVNFGKEVGAAATLLLKQGISGMTVVKTSGKTIKYIDTKEAIKERNVNLDLVSLHENLGICFGRSLKAPQWNFKKIDKVEERYL